MIPRELALFYEFMNRGIWCLMGDEHFAREVIRVIQDCRCSSILETGTYKGWTARFFAEAFELPVFTSETHKGLYHEARELLRGVPRVNMCNEPSVNMLDYMLHGPGATGDEPERGQIGDLPFFFLDAHSQHSCPLLEELDLVAKYGTGVICIHDFQVPDRSCYGYDVYHGQPINAAWIRPHVGDNPIYVPTEPSGELFPHMYDYVSTGPESRRRGRAFVPISPSERASVAFQQMVRDGLLLKLEE